MAKTHYDRWEEEFLPVKNHLNENAPISGLMYETFGAEVAHVLEIQGKEPERIWTIVETDSGKWYVTKGFRRVNRIGYLIAKKPFQPSNLKHARYETRDVLYL